MSGKWVWYRCKFLLEMGRETSIQKNNPGDMLSATSKKLSIIPSHH